MAISVVLYLQYLGLPEPSGWEGDHHLLVIYLWSVATLRLKEPHWPRNQRGCCCPAVPGGAPGTWHLVRLLPWLRDASRWSGWRHSSAASQRWPHADLSRKTVILVPADCSLTCLILWLMLCYITRDSYFLRHNTEDTFFQYKTKLNKNYTHTQFF